MIKGFDDIAFMEYLQENFRGFENCFLRSLVENIIEYASENHHTSKDQFIFFLLDILPEEFEFGEIAQFANDEILTTAGQTEKMQYLAEHEND